MPKLVPLNYDDPKDLTLKHPCVLINHVTYLLRRRSISKLKKFIGDLEEQMPLVGRDGLLRHYTIAYAKVLVGHSDGQWAEVKALIEQGEFWTKDRKHLRELWLDAVVKGEEVVKVEAGGPSSSSTSGEESLKIRPSPGLLLLKYPYPVSIAETY